MLGCSMRKQDSKLYKQDTKRSTKTIYTHMYLSTYKYLFVYGFCKFISVLFIYKIKNTHTYNLYITHTFSEAEKENRTVW